MLRAELNQNGPLAPDCSIPIFIQTLDAVHTVHKQEIIHWDLKPENIFIQYPNTEKEHIKILSLGIAQSRCEERLNLIKQLLNKQISPLEYIQDNVVSKALDINQMALFLVESCTETPFNEKKQALTGLRQHTRATLYKESPR
jgi:serine/threonine protein kinase